MQMQLKPRQKAFTLKYLTTGNATQSYLKVYGKISEETAAANASRLLSSAKVVQFIADIDRPLLEQAKVSRARLIAELEKIAFSTIKNYQSDWSTLKEWEEISDHAKGAIQGIKQNAKGVEYKLYDKLRAIDLLIKMMGHYS